MEYPQIDYTLLIKDARNSEEKYYYKPLKKPAKPDSWDENNFITWIICGEPTLRAELPEIK